VGQNTLLDPTFAAANQDEAEDSGGGVPALVVTEAEEVSPETDGPDGKPSAAGVYS